MFFSEILTKLRPLSAWKGATASETSNKQATLEKPKISQEFSHESDRSLHSKKGVNQALKNIEEAIQKDGPSDGLLLRKSEILLQKGKFNKARQLLQQLAKGNKNKRTLNAVRTQIVRAEQLQKQASQAKANSFYEDLHETARKFGTNLPELPKTATSQKDFDIALYIRQEARKARTSDLPKLSYSLIDQTLKAGHESPWLIHDKALSLYMMGQSSQALKLLKDLSKKSKGEKITKSIQEKIERIQNNKKRYLANANYYLAKQVTALGEGLSFRVNLPSEATNTNNKSNLKPLIFKQARALINANPRASLELVDSILDYNPGDLASLQLKGEALFTLKRAGEAIQIWKQLTLSSNKKISDKACELISQSLAKQAKKVDRTQTPKAAISLFIQQQLKHNLVPKINNEIKPILNRIEPPNSDFADPELHEHQLQLLFNTMVIECLEAQLREQGRLGGTSTAQKPGTIRKTAPKAG